jgi:energy-coupling factor transporter ATP-binding protein EcfA2
MSSDALMQRLAEGVFTPAVAYRDLADVHLDFRELSRSAPEADLREHAERERGSCAVVGASGAGKSSIIAAVAAALEPSRFPVRVRGGASEHLLTREGFSLHIARETLAALETLERPRALRRPRRRLAPSVRTSRRGARASAAAPLPVEFRAEVGTTAQEVTEQRDAVSIAAALEELVALTAGFGRRLLLIVEDTDVFMPPRLHGETELDRPRRFIDQVVGYLAREFPSASLIAVNSRYAGDLPAGLVHQVAVPRLKTDAVARLIEHYAHCNGLELEAGSIIEPDALAYVTGRYAETNDIRQTLDLLDKAARKMAGEERGDRITVDVLHGL